LASRDSWITVEKATSPMPFSRVLSVRALAKREGADHRSIARLLRLALLSPAIVEAIAAGRQPPDLTITCLTRWRDLPLLWSAQEQALSLR
jgi:site-specific DNA recombinase